MSISLSKEQHAIYHFDQLIDQLRKKEVAIVGHLTHWNTHANTLKLVISLDKKEAVKAHDLPSDSNGFPIEYVYMDDIEFASYR